MSERIITDGAFRPDGGGSETVSPEVLAGPAEQAERLLATVHHMGESAVGAAEQKPETPEQKAARIGALDPEEAHILFGQELSHDMRQLHELASGAHYLSPSFIDTFKREADQFSVKYGKLLARPERGLDDPMAELWSRAVYVTAGTQMVVKRVEGSTRASAKLLGNWTPASEAAIGTETLNGYVEQYNERKAKLAERDERRGQ
jgi:hypothetical protein